MPESTQTVIKNMLRQAVNDLEIGDAGTIELQHPSSSEHGDYASNVAMVLFKQVAGLEKITSPRSLAEAIVTRLKQNPDFDSLFDQVLVAGPGFINFTISVKALQNNLSALASAKDLSSLLPHSDFRGKRIMVEFTDPNPFKEFHIGHLYSNTVGMAISRLFEVSGAEVKRVNYQGDVGMHVAKSVWGMLQKLPEFYPAAEILASMSILSQEPLKKRIEFLGVAYAFGATAYEENEAAATEIKQVNFMTYLAGQETLTESGDWKPQVAYGAFIDDSARNQYQQIKTLYQTGRSWSLEYFETIYQRLGMHFDDYFFESVVGEFGVKIVREYLAKGVFEESQGAVIFPGSKHGLHDRVFLNSMGLPTYEAKELGLAPEKYRRWPYDKSVIITGNEINEYFKVLLQALHEVRPELAEKTEHLSHGMVRLPEGKMSSRTGKILTGEWLLNEAHEKAWHKIQEVTKTKIEGASNYSNPSTHVKSSEQSDVAEKVALSAIKYAFLKNGIGKDISFSFEESLNFQGNSGPYLQYTVVRCKSILGKMQNAFDGAQHMQSESSTNKHIDTLVDKKVHLDHSLEQIEKDILRNIYRYFEVIELATKERAPHHVCTYVYNLAQQFNAFYGTNVVLEGVEAGIEHLNAKTAFRLLLVRAVEKIVMHAFSILNIPVVEKM